MTSWNRSWKRQLTAGAVILGCVTTVKTAMTQTGVPVGTQIVVDDNDSTGVVIGGNWNKVTGTTGTYGSSLRNDSDAGKGTKTILFRPNFPVNGLYKVEAWWKADTNRSQAVPFQVISAEGTDTITVNERQNGAQWNVLTTKHFVTGSTSQGSVFLSNANTTGVVIGDAIRWTLMAAAPSTPTNFTATANGSDIALQWSPVSGATSYRVFRSTNGVFDTNYVSTPFASVTGTSYVDNSAVSGTTYYYVVLARNDGGDSPRSIVQNASPVAPTPTPTPSPTPINTDSLVPPTNLEAEVQAGKIALSWTNSPAATASTFYQIFRSTTSGVYGSTPLATVSGTTTSYLDNIGYNNANGTTYYYTIRLLDSNGQYAGPSSFETSATFPVVPEAPTNLVGAAGNGSVSLSWDAANGATRYYVRRQDGTSGGFITIQTVTSTNFIDYTVTNGQLYQYIVQSNNDGGNGGFTNTVTVTPSAGSPTPTPTPTPSAPPVSPATPPSALPTPTPSNTYYSLNESQLTNASKFQIVDDFVGAGPVPTKTMAPGTTIDLKSVDSTFLNSYPGNTTFEYSGWRESGSVSIAGKVVDGNNDTLATVGGSLMTTTENESSVPTPSWPGRDGARLYAQSSTSSTFHIRNLRVRSSLGDYYGPTEEGFYNLFPWGIGGYRQIPGGSFSGYATPNTTYGPIQQVYMSLQGATENVQRTAPVPLGYWSGSTSTGWTDKMVNHPASFTPGAGQVFWGTSNLTWPGTSIPEGLYVLRSMATNSSLGGYTAGLLPELRFCIDRTIPKPPIFGVASGSSGTTLLPALSGAAWDTGIYASGVKYVRIKLRTTAAAYPPGTISTWNWETRSWTGGEQSGDAYYYKYAMNDFAVISTSSMDHNWSVAHVYPGSIPEGWLNTGTYYVDAYATDRAGNGDSHSGIVYNVTGGFSSSASKKSSGASQPSANGS